MRKLIFGVGLHEDDLGVGVGINCKSRLGRGVWTSNDLSVSIYPAVTLKRPSGYTKLCSQTGLCVSKGMAECTWGMSSFIFRYSRSQAIQLKRMNHRRALGWTMSALSSKMVKRCKARGVRRMLVQSGLSTQSTAIRKQATALGNSIHSSILWN